MSSRKVRDDYVRDSASGVDAVLDRMCAVLGNPAGGYELVLDVPKRTIQTWRRRGEVPMRYLKAFCEEHQVSLDKVLNGVERYEAKPNSSPALGEPRPPVMGGSKSTWRETLAMFLDVLLADRPGLSGARVIDWVDRIHSMEQAGLKLDGQMLQTLIANWSAAPREGDHD